jgi:hypothetical protein
MAIRLLRFGGRRKLAGVVERWVVRSGLVVVLALAPAAGATTTTTTTAAPTAAPTAASPASTALTVGATTPIPEGAALWYACTEPVFSGPLFLRCPVSYNPGYLETFLGNFQRFTPENEFKMEFTEPLADRFYFKVADQVARFALEYHKTIRGHTLIWGQQNPLWLSNPGLPWNRT